MASAVNPITFCSISQISLMFLEWANRHGVIRAAKSKTYMINPHFHFQFKRNVEKKYLSLLLYLLHIAIADRPITNLSLDLNPLLTVKKIAGNNFIPVLLTISPYRPPPPI